MKQMIQIKPKFSAADIRNMVAKRKQIIEAAILSRLEIIGERFISDARQRADFRDDTGNLRNSIGYVILMNGLQKSGSDWVEVIPGGSAGIAAGKRVIADLAKKYPSGFVLICVAGMEYAAAVESKGYDVITNSSIAAADRFKKSVEQLKKKISKL